MGAIEIEGAPWLARYLKQEGAERIEAAVAKAERTTSAEVVPMIVRCSSTTGHVPVLLFCLPLLIFLFADGAGYLARNFGAYQIPCWLLVLATLGLCARLLSQLAWLQRLLSDDRDLLLQVERRAALEFYQAGLNQTTRNTGVLIFLSLMEHRVVVLSDEAIASQLPAAVWTDLVNLLLAGVKAGDFAQGFVAAIEAGSVVLAERFPCQTAGPNEICNKLRIKN